MNIKKLDFTSKKNLVKDACKLYKRVKGVQLSDEVLKRYNTSAKNTLELNKTMKVKSIFEQILNLLSPTSYMIIDNLFLKEHEEKEKWIDQYFSKTTFYKRQHEAIDEFLDYLYEK
ncbi:Uncharacterised protein [Mycoplasmopsis californica]|uniref:Phage protein n=1 Tax=Mycoplasmopsis equigenitalium TaxID=114883 RepID=A0ABY5J112_9BACT|nr:hypothetical protein [Mycoplasmopsis equigenitalium]UUD36946.1 hypothetical protein NPA09_03540 [Mycoplasmopsis equigenitalium]VEU69759.1 Uncharacterised protein [Mycoplasmopsis californica]